ncbi:hypothetical protein SLS62_003167 [Diatrype stigma]|uniref:Major facilitator superfamily (MFS) profile domain-containing protein n=1 Tax=Diatrype stigma TaxID=117547 RepID=A0AAN9V7A9_9PEZI
MADTVDKNPAIEQTSSNEDSVEISKACAGGGSGGGHRPAVVDLSGVANLDNARRRGLQPPEIIARLGPEGRLALEAKLRRKIDLRLLPMIILMYIMNYIDRNNIAAAKLAGLPEDLKLDPASGQFQTAVSILFVGYLLMQIPSNLFLNKLGKPAVYLPICMIIWGVISAATAAVTSFGGLIAVRFFLGFVEAAYFPGCLYYLSCWYTRKELGLRTAFLYSGALISGAFSGLISAGITGNMNGTRGYSAWQWLFIIEGVVTVGVAAAAYFILPNFPRTTTWLSEEEKALAVWRLEEDIGEDDWIDSEHQSFWKGAKMAFTDSKTYVLLVLLTGVVSSGSVTNFFPAVVKTLGYDDVTSLLLTSPPYVLTVITSIINAWHADKTGERYWHVTPAATTSFGLRYFSMLIMRPPAKRAAALAFINAVSNATSIYASYMYLDHMSPRYIVAMSVNCCTSFLAIIAATVLRFMLVRLNRKLDKGIHVEGAVNNANNALPGEAAQHGFRFKI